MLDKYICCALDEKKILYGYNKEIFYTGKLTEG